MRLLKTTLTGITKAKDKTKRIDQEHNEQVTLFKWAQLSIGKYPELRLLFAIPNGGHRNIIVAKKMKQEGVKRGVPDLCLPVARGGYNGLFIELKREKGSYPTPEQKEWLKELKKQGYLSRVCYGWEKAKDLIINYLEGGEKRVSD